MIHGITICESDKCHTVSLTHYHTENHKNKTEIPYQS
jgi:hypothetical protein